MKSSDVEKFERLFNPRSVAVIGATDSFGKWGFSLFSVLLEAGSGVKAYPVNPTVAEVHGVKSYKSVADIPEPVDLALIVVPAAHVPQVMEDCVEKGIKVAVVISAGFAELGVEGREIQKEMVEIARRGGMRFVGPNTMGHFSTASGFNSLECTPMIGQVGLGECGGVPRYAGE